MADKIIITLLALGLIFMVLAYVFEADEPNCPKTVYEIKGDAVLSRDCNGSEYIWTPAPYGVNRVYKIGDEIE